VIFKTPTQYFLGFWSLGWLHALETHLTEPCSRRASGTRTSSECRASSPPHCQLISPVPLPLGALVPVAYASMTSEEPGQIISAGVALAFPVDEERNGLIMEYSAKGERREIEEKVRTMAVEGMKLSDGRSKTKSIAIGSIA